MVSLRLERMTRDLAKVPPPTEEWRSQMMEKYAKNPEALFRDPPHRDRRSFS